MSQPPKRPSFRELHGRRRSTSFVGRGAELTAYGDNLRLSAEDPRRSFIFAVDGQGGMGKSSLLQRFRELAYQQAARCGWSDEAQSDAIEVMTAWARELDPDMRAFERFDQRRSEYQSRRDEIERDPNVSVEVAELIGRAVGKSSVVLGRRIPVAGAALDFVDEQQAGETVGNAIAELAERLGKNADVTLLSQPLETLTPLFLDGLAVLDERPIALFLDTFEATAPYVEPWLLRVLRGELGELPGNFVLTIAGRYPLTHNLWSDYADVLVRASLNPFDVEEARAFLELKGVRPGPLSELMLELSGGIPLLLATLASESPENDVGLHDPTDTAVERFLKWIADPRERDLALVGAVPRRLDREIVALLVGKDDERLYGWLTRLPFVVERGGRRAYHPTVREQMVRQLRRESPRRWKELHSALAEHYSASADATGSEASAQRHEAALERTYHRTIANDGATVRDVGHWAVNLPTTDRARRIARSIAEAEHDGDLPAPPWGERLQRTLDEEDGVGVSVLVDEILTHFGDELSNEKQAQILSARYTFLLGRAGAKRELTDLIRAQELAFDPVRAVLIASEASYATPTDQAVADLKQALTSDEVPDTILALGLIVLAQCQLARREPALALAALQEAITADPKDADIGLMHAGLVFEIEGREAGLEQFEALRQRSPNTTHATHHLAAKLLRVEGQVEQTESELRAAINSDPTCLHCWFGIGRLFADHPPPTGVALTIASLRVPTGDEADELLGRAAACDGAGLSDDASDLYSRGLALRPRDANALAHLGDILLKQRKPGEGLKLLDEAVEVAPDWWWPRYRRAVGRLASQTPDVDRAVADLDIVLRNDSAPSLARWWRAKALVDRNPMQAIDDAGVYLVAEPRDPDGYEVRARAYSGVGEYELAAKDFEAALITASEEDRDALLNDYGLVLTYLERYDDARLAYSYTDDSLPKYYNIAVAAWRAQHDDATECLVTAATWADKEGDQYARSYARGGLAALQGRSEQALVHLVHALSGSSEARRWARQDMAWKELRDDARFVRACLDHG